MMAIYEYFCPKCRQGFELMRPMKEAELVAECPKCHSRADKLPSVFASTAGYGINVPSKEAYRKHLR